MTNDNGSPPPTGASTSRLRDERWAAALVAGYIREIADERSAVPPEGPASDPPPR